jgi:hypothetical protein
MRFRGERRRIVRPDTHEELPAPRDLTALITALHEPALRPATLFVEGTSMNHEVVELLAATAVEPAAQDLSGTIWPKSRQLHVPLTDDVVGSLAAFAARMAPPEVCDHLVVYRDDVVLLAAYDAGQDPVWLARAVSPIARQQIARIAAGGGLT